jgi:hypothetical protein
VGRVHVEEAAAVRSQLLDRDLRGGRAHRQYLLGELRLLGLGLALLVEDRLAVGTGDRFVVLDGLHDGRRHVGLERLHDTLRDEDQCQDEGQGQQDVEGRPRQINPEVTDRRRRAPAEPPDEGHQRRHPGRRRGEVLHGEAQHLGEIAHGALAAVALPVRVGGEAHRGVERRVRRHRRQPLRIERQDALQPLQQVDGQQAEDVEQEHGHRVGLPAHLLVRPDAGQPVDQAL